MPDMSHTISCPAHPGSDDDCTCGLVHRIALATEQEMHAAWRKRAEEAESELAALREAAGRVEELEKALRAVEKYSQLGIDNDEAVKCDATDHIRVREIAREALGAVK